MNKGVGIGVIMLMIGLVLFMLTATDAYTLAFNKVRIEDKSFGTYEENDIAEGEIEFVVDKVGEATVTKRIFLVPYRKVTVPIYIISNDGGYVLLQSEEHSDKLEILRQQTVDYFNKTRSEAPEKVSYIGKATEVSDEILQVLDTYFTARHITAENWENAISLYVLVGFDLTIVVIQLSISFGLIFIGALLMIIFRRYVQGEQVYVGEKPPSETDQPPADTKPQKADSVE